MDLIFTALSAGPRRRILAELYDQPADGVQVPEAILNDGEERRDLEIALHHKHLPLLDDYGFIDWDPETSRVMKGRRFDDLQPFLESLDDQADEVFIPCPRKGQS
ncbi:ArsR family transcriptional regulator [Saliphagus sp. GCM10025317]